MISRYFKCLGNQQLPVAGPVIPWPSTLPRMGHLRPPASEQAAARPPPGVQGRRQIAHGHHPETKLAGHGTNTKQCVSLVETNNKHHLGFGKLRNVQNGLQYTHDWYGGF